MVLPALPDNLLRYTEGGVIPPKFSLLLRHFHDSYFKAIQQQKKELSKEVQLFEKLIELIANQLKNPYIFGSFHKSIRTPFDYHQFGLDLIRPLIDFSKSKRLGLEQVDRMTKQLQQGDNVVLLANHQTEPDPQIIALLLEQTHPTFAADMIFVAGHRVISDPLAVPLSLGCNLLCIYSKKHLAHPPEDKERKIAHNQRTLKAMGELLSQGGQCIYVAPSGGRDRPDAHGHIDVAHFDASSIEMFRLIAQQATHPTHFYPLALATYDLLPPPNSVEKELGEARHTRCTPVHMAFGQEIDMENFHGSEHLDKRTIRTKRAEAIWGLVKEEYKKLVMKNSP